MIARPNLLYLARADESGAIAVSHIADRFPLWRDEHAHQGAIMHLAWSPDGRFLASAGLDGYVRIWQSTSGELLYAFAHGLAVRRLRWSPDSTRIASISSKQIHLWSLHSTMAAAA